MARRARGKPCVLTLYGTEIWHYKPKKGLDLFTRAYRNAAPRDLLQPRAADAGSRAGPGAPPGVSRLPARGARVHLPRLRRAALARMALGIRARHVLVNVKRLHPLAGQRYLLEALGEVVRTHPDTRLIICGTGPLLDELESRRAHQRRGRTRDLRGPRGQPGHRAVRRGRRCVRAAVAARSVPDGGARGAGVRHAGHHSRQPGRCGAERDLRIRRDAWCQRRTPWHSRAPSPRSSTKSGVPANPRCASSRRSSGRRRSTASSRRSIVRSPARRAPPHEGTRRLRARMRPVRRPRGRRGHDPPLQPRRRPGRGDVARPSWTASRLLQGRAGGGVDLRVDGRARRASAGGTRAQRDMGRHGSRARRTRQSRVAAHRHHPGRWGAADVATDIERIPGHRGHHPRTSRPRARPDAVDRLVEHVRAGPGRPA